MWSGNIGRRMNHRLGEENNSVKSAILKTMSGNPEIVTCETAKYSVKCKANHPLMPIKVRQIVVSQPVDVVRTRSSLYAV